MNLTKRTTKFFIQLFFFLLLFDFIFRRTTFFSKQSHVWIVVNIFGTRPTTGIDGIFLVYITNKNSVVVRRTVVLYYDIIFK